MAPATFFWPGRWLGHQQRRSLRQRYNGSLVLRLIRAAQSRLTSRVRGPHPAPLTRLSFVQASAGACPLAYRELHNAFGLTSTAATGLVDSRTGQNTQHGLRALLRQSLCSRLAGYEDVNDVERLCLDPTMRIVVGGRAKDQTAASPSELARPDSGAPRRVEPRLWLGLRLAALPNGSESRRPASVVRRAGRFRELRNGEASGSLGSGCDGGGYRWRFFVANCCSSSRGWVSLTAGVDLEAPG
jgi:hypothetical protein